MYEVINFFTDLQDGEYPYSVGDLFPREGLEVSGERLKELSTSNNLQRKPLIKRIEEKRYTKSEIQRMNKAELQELAVNLEIEGAYDMTGAELKDNLLKILGL